MYDNNKSLTENAMNGVDITEPDLPTDLDITADEDFVPSGEVIDGLINEINEYLSDKYGYCVNSYSYSIKIHDIDWDLNS